MSGMIDRGIALDYAQAVARCAAALFVAYDAGRGEASAQAAYDIGCAGSTDLPTCPHLRGLALAARRMAEAERVLLAVGYSRATIAEIGADAAAPIREEWDTVNR